MTKVEKSVLVPFSAAQMYQLVDAVECYPEFLPWCGGTNVLQRNDEITEATLHINYHSVKQSFTTINSKQFPTHMQIQLKDGPFSQLNGAWHFKALNEQACKIEFTLQYQFANLFLEKIISPVFSHIANTFVDAFVARAEKVY